MPDNVQLDADKVVAEYQRKLTNAEFENVQWKVAYDELQTVASTAINENGRLNQEGERKDRVIEALTIALQKYEPVEDDPLEEDLARIEAEHEILEADEILPPPTPIRGRPRKQPIVIDVAPEPDRT